MIMMMIIIVMIMIVLAMAMTVLTSHPVPEAKHVIRTDACNYTHNTMRISHRFIESTSPLATTQRSPLHVRAGDTHSLTHSPKSVALDTAELKTQASVS
jgi:hypothetical protein